MRAPLVTHLTHVALTVPHPEDAARWYAEVLGLAIIGRLSDGGVRLATAPPHAAVVAHTEVLLLPGALGVHHIGFGIPNTESLAAAAAALRRQDVEVHEAVDGPCGVGWWVRDPDGHRVEVTVPPSPVPRPGGAGGPATLVKLGHITQRSPDPVVQAAWWQRVLGFRLSDRMGETFAWLRCNRDHHTIAFVRAPEPGTHHIAFEAGGWDDLRRFGDHLTSCGWCFEFGPGRHGPGNNLFAYLLDPWGLRWEVFCDLVRIDDEEAYTPGEWDPGARLTTVNRWGPQPPESFLR
jgi:catechol 2,3-dioxygenase-like lactoylglutathione lyase family enzyme